MLQALNMWLDEWPITPGAREYELTPDQVEDRKLAHQLREELQLEEYGAVSPCHCIECHRP